MSNSNGKSRETLLSKWLIFANLVIPENAPAIQKKEMRRSYYAGASAMFDLFTNMPDDISEEDGAVIISALQQECADFLSRVGKDF
ncbi:hypothetical protein COO91_03477 [Nostoc flagelliforme CCNUN1]|uniref:Uncharacterized protein n=1 Tax=Nostoc flagelliforme CCNUN1 TaxID=2038116 RepID=A0A2K8SPZ6_9NOSO|nr:hypothetical protein [Nostoc flagelliforme]AUB37532.1 hypothetical protein COO91_03477 [Nostoc flagelliforme CCNUN1]